MIEKLYKRYSQELVRWCSLMTKDSQLSEEFVQETFLRAMQNNEVLLTLDEKQQRSWLYRTTKNLYTDYLRRSRFETPVDKIFDNTECVSETSDIEWKQLIESLPDIEGLLFTMRYLQGYNSNQIGKMFSMPSGTVRSKLSSARRHLREMLGGK